MENVLAVHLHNWLSIKNICQADWAGAFVSLTQSQILVFLYAIRVQARRMLVIIFISSWAHMTTSKNFLAALFLVQITLLLITVLFHLIYRNLADSASVEKFLELLVLTSLAQMVRISFAVYTKVFLAYWASCSLLTIELCLLSRNRFSFLENLVTYFACLE